MSQVMKFVVFIFILKFACVEMMKFEDISKISFELIKSFKTAVTVDVDACWNDGNFFIKKILKLKIYIKLLNFFYNLKTVKF
jgi:hypothetical protein